MKLFFTIFLLSFFASLSSSATSCMEVAKALRFPSDYSVFFGDSFTEIKENSIIAKASAVRELQNQFKISFAPLLAQDFSLSDNFPEELVFSISELKGNCYLKEISNIDGVKEIKILDDGILFLPDLDLFLKKSLLARSLKR